MLEGAGLSFECTPANIDEAAIKSDLEEKKAPPEDIASILAYEKALAVSKKYPEALVIGSDQILVFENEILSKAEDEEHALQKLMRLQGKTHRLISSVCVFQNEHMLWDYADHASLTMHELSDQFLTDYCAKAGDVLTICVGAYALEAQGSWLFSKIEGDFYTILGMPLLPLLSYLRTEQGIIFE